MTPDITVLIPTYNRARDLARTLEGMVRAEKEDLAIEFVVVDNGSTDSTKMVVDSFGDRISIQYFFEPRNGKNRALNTALEKARIAEILVFTDDDVDVSRNWFVSIASTCRRWPQVSVFGGQIKVIFPTEDLPEWTTHPFIQRIAFAQHDYSDKECLYENGQVPYGPNYWVRRHIFENGRRFDERIGPHPTKRTLGDETLFLSGLLNDGYEIVYSPTVIVGHRIQQEILKRSNILKRAYQLGRSVAFTFGLAQSTLLKHHPALWMLSRCGGIPWNVLKVIFSAIFSSNEKRLVNCVYRIRDLGHQIESMRVVKQIRRDKRLED
jgi:glycosyltransferase involved in cell wall biosynthesis